MTVIQFDDAACRRIRARLDAYLSDELAVETVAEVERHLAGCEACSSELASMETLRVRLRGAVAGDPVPAGLRDAVRGRLLKERKSAVPGWLAVAAAVLLVVGGSTISKRVTGFLPHQLLAIELEVRSLVRQVAFSFAPALIDHVHCALYRSYPDGEPPPEKLAMELGEGAELAEIVKAAAPAGAELRLAHKCNFGGREFRHFVLVDGEKLVSVVVTERGEGEGFGAGRAPQSTQAEAFQIAGFEAGPYLAFVISDLDAEANLEFARNLVEPLRRYLG